MENRRGMSKEMSNGDCCIWCGGCLVFIVLLTLLTALVPVRDDCLLQRVENGTLYTLDLDKGASTVNYNLSVVFAFEFHSLEKTQNLDDLIRVAEVTVALSYGGQKLGADASLPPFVLQRREAASMVRPMQTQGRQITGAGAVESVARTKEEDAAQGYYRIEAKLHLRVLDHRWCDSSCTLSFLPPTSRRGGPYMFDGEECSIKCRKRGALAS